MDFEKDVKNEAESGDRFEFNDKHVNKSRRHGNVESNGFEHSYERRRYEQHSVEESNNKLQRILSNTTLDLKESPDGAKKKKLSSETQDSHCTEDEGQSVKREFSTPKKTKKKKPSVDEDQIKEELLSPGSLGLIKTKASLYTKKFPFPLFFSNDSLSNSGDENQRNNVEYIESLESTKNSKKHKKNKVQDSSFKSEIESTKNKSETQKWKKKKEKLDESILSTDYSFNESFSSADEHTGKSKKAVSNEDDPLPKSKKKKRKNGQVTDEIDNREAPTKKCKRNKHDKSIDADSHKSDSVTEELPDFSLIKKKKKKKHQQSDSSIMSESFDATDDLLRKNLKKKKIKQLSEETKLSTDYSSVGESSDADKHTKLKKKKRKNNLEEEQNSINMDKIIKKSKSSISGSSTEGYKKHKKRKSVCGSTFELQQQSDSSFMSEHFDVIDDLFGKKIRKKKKYHSMEETKLSTDYSSVGESSDADKHTKLKKKKHKNNSEETIKKSKSSISGSSTEGHKKHKKTIKSVCGSTFELPQDQGSILHTSANTKKKKQKTSKKENSDSVKVEPSTPEKSSSSKKQRASLTENRLKKLFLQHETSTPKQTKLVEKSLDTTADLTLQDEEMQKLSGLSIALPWSIPPLHLIETRVAGRPTESQRKSIETLDVKIKTGCFNKAEDKQIQKNWKAFCKLHDLSTNPTPFLNFENSDGKLILPTEERIKFVRFLAHGLENRLLCAVYRRFRRLFLQDKKKSGRFTPKEDETIIDYIQSTSSKTPYADLAKLLNRDRLSIEKRCIKLGEHIIGTSTIKWNRDTIEEFMKHFVEVTDVGDYEELRNRSITSEEWTEMKNRLNISADKLRQAWYCRIYSRLFIEDSIATIEVKERLIPLLIERGENDWKTIKWDEIAEGFEGFTGRKLNKIVKHMVDYRVSSEQQGNVKECLRVLDEDLKNKRIRGHRIKKLKVTDNRPLSDR